MSGVVNVGVVNVAQSLLDNLVPDIFYLAKGGYVTHKRNQRTVSKHKLIDIHREAKKWDEI